ncbi:TetR/AcrR family transcriptional regulator [Wenjunlia tyrosinilytica]|uniref:TetR family transcriptional regulator n=1 Tax=Wenjunlia tyrosinilytica TaxID=1544741 RepID=A0A917ZB86_9ACTN|nr:TetR/AcrR family transcriptional regulator [Wenjunlia tyrosinilytica]GGO80135.1 TetR family transcriptional regulator [Wenjunlia tyrosinilytica]
MSVGSRASIERVRGRGLTGRQAQLFDQLVDLFLAEGFADFTLDDLAGRLRCSKSTLYALASSKEQLAVAVVKYFFRRAAGRVEQRTSQADGPLERVGAYLSAVARELRPASARFYQDLAAFPPALEVYGRNTRIAAARVRSLVDEGVRSGAFRQVHAAFVGEIVSTAMVAIQRGEISERTGLRDAEAYDELATMLLHGISAPE